jgi:hypothetical protein
VPLQFANVSGYITINTRSVVRPVLAIGTGQNFTLGSILSKLNSSGAVDWNATVQFDVCVAYFPCHVSSSRDRVRMAMVD